MSTGQELKKSLQQLADELHLVALDHISLNRSVLTFEDGSEVIVNNRDPEFKNCRFRLLDSNTVSLERMRTLN